MANVNRGGTLLVMAGMGAAGLTYALNIILSWTLSAADYGLLGVSQSFIFLGGWFLISGFPWVMTKALAKAGKDDIATVYRLLKSALVGNVFLGGLLAGGLWLAFVTRLLPLGAGYSAPIAWVAVIIFLLGVRLGFDALLQGRLEFGRLGLVRSVEAVAQFGTAVLLVRLGYGASGALAGFAFGTATSLGLVIWLTRRVRFWQVAGFGDGILVTFRSALPFLLANLCGVLLINVDLLAVKFLSSPDQADLLVGQYQVAAVLARIPYFLSQSVIAIIFPLIAREPHNLLRDNWAGRHVLQLTMGGITGVSLFLIAIPEVAITLFFPPSYLIVAPVLRLLAIAIAFIIWAQGLAAILQARGYPGRAAGALLVAVSSQIVILLWGVPQFKTVGAALATTLAGVVGLAAMLLVMRYASPTLIKLSPRSMVARITAFVLSGILF